MIQNITAREVLFEYEPYRSMSPHEIGMRVDVPVHLQKFQHWRLPSADPGQAPHDVMFTWARPKLERNILKLIGGECPDYEFWEDHDPTARLWIVDLAASPGTSGLMVGRFLSWVLAETEIARVGEMVIFRRNGGINPGRFGKAVVRG